MAVRMGRVFRAWKKLFERVLGGNAAVLFSTSSFTFSKVLSLPEDPQKAA